MKKDEIKLLRKTDPDRIEQYMRIFDRVLLYTIASAMPSEMKEASVKVWDKLIKKTIDIDASSRTNYLESTSSGRMAKMNKEADGEDVRLYSLEQMELARKIIESNLYFSEDSDVAELNEEMDDLFDVSDDIQDYEDTLDYDDEDENED